MRMPIAALVLSAGVILAACETPEAPVQTAPKDSVPVVKPSPRALSRLVIRLETPAEPIFADDHGWIAILGFDEKGNPVGTAGASVTLSDPDAADAAISTTEIRSGSVTYTNTQIGIRFLKAGRLTVTAQLGSISEAAYIDVVPTPLPSTAIAVDSFAVVEFRPGCSWECIGYVPVFRIREATGQAPAMLVAVKIELEGMTMGQCRGAYALTAGQRLEIAGLDPYPWNNDLVAVTSDGTRVPGDSATARLVVRDGAGRFGRVEVRGPILRIETKPTLPPPANVPWTC